MNYYDHITNMVTLTRVESQKSLSITENLDIQKNLLRPKNLKLQSTKKISTSEINLVQQRRKSTPNGFGSKTNLVNGDVVLDNQKVCKNKNLASSESSLIETLVEKSPRKLWSVQKRPVSSIELSTPRKISDTKTPAKVSPKTPTETPDKKKLTVDIKLANQKLGSTPKSSKSKSSDVKTPKTPFEEKLASQEKLSKVLSEKLDLPEIDEETKDGLKIPVIVTTDVDQGEEVDVGSEDDNEYETDGNLKAQSSSPRLSASPSSAGSGGGGKPGGSSKARQKKFHRHFQQVAEEERVINYYSCALVSDILLQGHLYITNNYFAFYSNVFGFVTKLLIPTASVLKISKEKTARIIPNAVGVATLDEKHVFGSFMSRDSAHRLMLQVWRAARPNANGDDASLAATRDIIIQPGDLECSECSADEYSSGSGSGTESPPVPIPVPVSAPLASGSTGSIASLTCRGRALKGAAPAVPISGADANGNGGTGGTNLVGSDKEKGKKTTTLLKVLDSIPRHTLLLVLSTALLVLLFLSAGFLLYRIGQLHDRSPFKGMEPSGNNEDVYGEVLRWQAELRSQSANEVHNMLATHLDQIIKVRRSLESLSMLLASDEATRSKHTERS